jgi:LPS export ABC transporter protein LptC
LIWAVGARKIFLPTSATRRKLPLAYALVVVGGLGLAGLYGWTLLGTDRVAGKADAPQKPVLNPTEASGEKARILGVDQNQQPYELTAAKGVQDAKQETLVHLETVAGIFQRPSGSKLNVTSKGAQYDTKSRALDLKGDVIFAEGDRFRAEMAEAAVNIDTQTLTSKSPVKVNVIGGTITADSMEVGENGTRIIFKGGVKARFLTQGKTTGDGP